MDGRMDLTKSQPGFLNHTLHSQAHGQTTAVGFGTSTVSFIWVVCVVAVRDLSGLRLKQSKPLTPSAEIPNL